MSQRFADIPISNDLITVIGSGHSVRDLSPEDFQFLKENSFVFTMNYAPVAYHGHVNMWSDKKVTTWMEMHYSAHSKETEFLVRDKALMDTSHPLHSLVDYWFSQRQDHLKGNYTIVWLLQLLEKHFPDKQVLILGLDLYYTDSKLVKWYDSFTNYDQNKRGRMNMDRKLIACSQQLDRFLKQKKQFINGNPKSEYKGFVRKDWRLLFKNLKKSA